MSGLVSIYVSRDTGYHAPCPAGFGDLQDDRMMDIHVVADTTLTTTGTPLSLPMTAPMVAGTVREGTLDNAPRVTAAEVVLSRNPSTSDALSSTLTDGSGRFLLCAAPPGTAAGTVMYFGVAKDGYRPTVRQITLTGDDQVDLELVPE